MDGGKEAVPCFHAAWRDMRGREAEESKVSTGHFLLSAGD